MKKMCFVLFVALFSTCVFAQEAYLQVTLTNDAVTKISLSDIKDFRFVTVAAPEPEPEPEPEPVIPDGAVDMGLSVMWAECNLGASEPEERGGYYAWGETETNSKYTWATYLANIGGTITSNSDCGTDNDPLRDYVYPNPNSIAGTEYDVAHIKLGGKWRMPTKDEMQELIDNTKHEWTTSKYGMGYKFTSKINGNSIFLPAAEYRNDSSNFYENTVGLYWSATPSSDQAYSSRILFFSSMELSGGYSSSRYVGCSVRPVSD